MKTWLVALMFGGMVILHSPAPAAAGGPGCAPTREVGIVPTIVVIPQVPNPVYRYDINTSGLTQMMNQKGSNGRQHSMTLGLTVGTFNLTGQIQPYTLRKGNIYCHYVRSAKVYLQIPSLTVYVASNYRQGSCQFQTITNHENEHVRVNQSVVRKYAPIMQEALLTATYRISPLASSNPQGGQALEQALQPAIASVLTAMYKERDHGNGIIDTEDAYRRTSQRCNHW